MTTPTEAPKASPVTGWIVIGILVLVPVLCIGGFIYNELAGPKGATPDRASLACQEFVKDRLRAPSTAEFSNMSATAEDDGIWRVTGRVEAQNPLGVPLRSAFTCVVEHNGGDWLLVRVTGV